MQLILAHVDPWGDDRADLRAAMNSIAVGQWSEEADRDEIFNSLKSYLGFDAEEDNEIEFNPEALKRVKAQNGRN